MIEIWINGERAITDDRTVIAYTFQNNDILKSINDRQFSYTNTFSLPKMPNALLLDNLGIPGNTSTKPYETNNVRIVDDGLEIISDGYGLIQSTAGDRIRMNVIAERGFIDSLKGLKLTDLDYSSFELALDPSTFYQPISGTPDPRMRGFTNIYFGDTTDRFELLDSIPCIQELSILKKIISDSPFTAENANINPIFPNDTYVLPVNGIDIDIDDTATYISFVLRSSSGGFSTKTFTSNTYTYDIGATFSLTGNAYQRMDIQFLEFIQAVQDGGSDKNVKHTVIIEVDDSEGTRQYEYELPDVTYGIDQNVDVEHLVIPINVQGSSPTGQLKMKVEIIDPSTISSAEVYHSIDANINKYSIDLENFDTLWGDLLPDMSQLDYFKDVLFRHGAMFKKERLSNTLTFKKLDDILSDKSNAADWSDKVIEKIEERYEATNYAQTNLYTSTDDYQNGSFDISNANLEDEKVVISSKFGNKLDSSLTKIYSDVFDEDNGYVNKLDSKDRTSIAPRIVVETTKASTDLYVLGMLVESGVNGYKAAEIDFQDFFDDNYTNLISMLDNYLEVKYRVKLSKTDLYNYDPFQLVYLRQEGAYFYVSRIKNVINDVGIAELIKVP